MVSVTSASFNNIWLVNFDDFLNRYILTVITNIRLAVIISYDSLLSFHHCVVFVYTLNLQQPTNLDAWLNLFSDIGPIGNPDTISKKAGQVTDAQKYA